MDFAADAAKMSFIDGDLAVPAAADLRPFNVWLDYPEDFEHFGGQSKPGAIVARPTITYATAAPGRDLARADQVTIKGTKYGVQNIRKIKDGAESTAELVKP